jgi:pSer/pThr/pTyr-binding forkhead associated (FHA) protein
MGESMSASQESHNDLTSTVHISQLRPVPDQTHFESLLEKLSQEDRTIIAQLSPEKAMLIGVTGPGKGFRFLLDSHQISIGRDIGTDISLDDVTVSRKHAQITSAEGVYKLEDTKSLNGTYVNAKIVDTHTLRLGDEIQIGKFRFIFFIGKANS